MKKGLVSIVAMFVMGWMLLFGTNGWAVNIDENTARQLGTYYLSVMTGKPADDSQASLVYTFMNEDLNVPAAYVFNVDALGFVVVSGSDLWYPILGYSTEGLLEVDKMAPAFKEYMEGLCEYIIYSQNTGEPLIEDIDKEWDELIYQKLPEMKSPKTEYWLLDNKWGQGILDTLTYNKFCPHKEVEGRELTAYVGCVATAMSQIMHYWKYPERPADTILNYECTLDGDFYDDFEPIDMSEVRYDYKNMPIRLSSKSPEEKIDAVALLCYHAGVSVEMLYGLSGSAAWSEKVPKALRDVFLFDTVIQWVSRANSNMDDFTEEPIYTNDEWVDILSEEISEGRPMYYRGHSRGGSGRDAGGHAFVCDGQHPIDSSKFHFNWGWDGQPNVWCDVRNNSLRVGEYNFNFNQSAVIHIQPRPEDPVGIEEDGKVKLYSAYPNPAMGEVNIPYELKSGEETMYVYGVDGRLMDKICLSGDANRVRLDVSDYPKGLYIYRLGGLAHKFIVK